MPVCTPTWKPEIIEIKEKCEMARTKKVVTEVKGEEKLEFKCKFYDKSIKGCKTKCPRNRTICCVDCVVFEKCLNENGVKDFVCEQVVEFKKKVSEMEAKEVK